MRACVCVMSSEAHSLHKQHNSSYFWRMKTYFLYRFSRICWLCDGSHEIYQLEDEDEEAGESDVEEERQAASGMSQILINVSRNAIGCMMLAARQIVPAPNIEAKH